MEIQPKSKSKSKSPHADKASMPTKDFLDSLKTLHLVNSYLESDGKKIILIVKIVNENSDNPQCIFKIIEKEKIWVKNYDFDGFNTYKTSIGFDGPWKSFFKTLECALNKSDGGNIIINYPKTNKEKELTLTVYHPLSEEMKIKSEIIFDKSYGSSTTEFRNLSFDAMLELYESKENYKLKEREKTLDMLKMNKSNGNGGLMNSEFGNERKVNAKLEMKKGMKRKFNANLINPNIKKRKGKGTEFVDDGQVEEYV
jgi:hypothetical protein